MGKKKMKVAIVTGIWRRFEIFEMFAFGVHQLIDNLPEIEFVCIVAGSEGEASREIVEGFDFEYIEIANDPLGKKMDATLLAAKEHDVDYVMCLGSDDIISVDLMKVYHSIMKHKVDFIGVTDFYFYDVNTEQASYWGGYTKSYNKGHTCGAGRLLSAKLLDQWEWNCWEGYDDQLDTGMQFKLDCSAYTECVFSIKDFDVFGLDIKSFTNMTPFELWDNTTLVDKDVIKNEFDFIWLEDSI